MLNVLILVPNGSLSESICASRTVIKVSNCSDFLNGRRLFQRKRFGKGTLSVILEQPLVFERPVPASDVPGEVAAPTQPFVDVPPPTNASRWPGPYWLADLIACGGCRRRARRSRDEGRFTPPSLEGTLVYPPSTGGMQWGGGAVDPATGHYYVNSSNIVQLYRLLPRERYEREASGSGDELGYYPQSGTPYGFQLSNFLNWLGMPCWKPPYGELSAYDLNAGTLLWRRPFGRVRRYGIDMPRAWGSPTIGGPVLASGGVLFIGASIDARVRAIDAATGEELWSARVAAPAVATPAVYRYRGRQYVVFVAGGNPILAPQVSDQVVAFALPEGEGSSVDGGNAPAEASDARRETP